MFDFSQGVREIAGEIDVVPLHLRPLGRRQGQHQGPGQVGVQDVAHPITPLVVTSHLQKFHFSL